MKIIPIRVPATAPVHTAGGIRQLAPDDPLATTRCPVCGIPLLDQPVTLVYVGSHPGDRKDSGWMTGAAVAVHATCTPPADPRVRLRNARAERRRVRETPTRQ